MTDPDAQFSQAGPLRQRHDLIDALRGFALAGVLMVNLASFTLYEFMPDAARAALPSARFDAVALQVMGLLVDIKFITLFSLLFGLGFAVQMERAQGGGGPGRFARRLLILAGIGLVHGYFVWWGDILLTYAVAGLLLVGFRHASDRQLLASGLVIALLVPPLLSPWVREWLSWLPKQPDVYASALQGFSSSSMGAALRSNIDVANWSRISNWALLCFVLGRFLLGYWAGRRGLLQRPAQHRKLIARIFWTTLALGIATTALQFVQADLRAQHALLDTTAGKLAIRVLSRAAPLALGITYAAGFTLLFLRPWWRRRLGVLVPVGRMALTHYLTQSMVGVALFYGAGLGLGPRWGVAGCWIAWAAIFAVQIALSHWWLARYRFGPAEWLWRSLTYGSWQPLRRPGVADAMPA